MKNCQPTNEQYSHYSKEVIYGKTISLCLLFLFFSIFGVEGQVKTVNPNLKLPAKVNTKITAKPLILKGQISVLNPSNGAREVPLNYEFKWKQIVGAQDYKIKLMEIATSGNPAMPTKTIDVTSSVKTQLPLENGRFYYWQVTTSDDNGKLYESEMRSFTTINRIPSGLALTNPANGDENVSKDVVLQWQPASDSDGDELFYTVYLSTEKDLIENAFSNSRVSDGQTTTNLPINDLLPGKTYYWRISVTDNRGGRIESAIYSFKVDPVAWTDPITTGVFTDTRDNKTYKTVTIGNQIWMAENLAYLPEIDNMIPDHEHVYRVYNYNGTDMSEAKATEEYQTYGVLYSFNAAEDACPSGWHIPSDNEWKELEMYLGMTVSEANTQNYPGRGRAVAGILREPGTSHWIYENSDVNNLSLFSALPGGTGSNYQPFISKGIAAFWWTSTNYGPSQMYNRELYSEGDNLELGRRGSGTASCLSVRCVKD